MDDNDAASNPPPHGYLAAPWRMRYLSKTAAHSGCVFCEKLASFDDVDNLVLWRGVSFAVIMNLYPYATGHVMLVPFDHLASPEELDDPELMSAMAAEIPSTMRALRRVLRCQGFNTGMNTGGAAGAGIADHLHMHIVPRWNGDANFMPVISKITVMPEELSVTYARLRAEMIAEHDPSRALGALVLSPDRSSVYLLDDNDTIPAVAADGERSIVSTMAIALDTCGLDASIAGWLGAETVVWRATPDSVPVEGRWVPISALAPGIQTLANEANSRLAHP